MWAQLTLYILIPVVRMGRKLHLTSHLNLDCGGRGWGRRTERESLTGGYFFFFFIEQIFFLTLFFKFIFIHLWLCWVFVSVRGLSLVVASGATLHRSARGLSLPRPLLLRSTGSRRAGSVIVAHGPSCSAACAIFPDQGLNPCPLHWQADSQPLRHQGSPNWWVLTQKELRGEKHESD